MDHREVMQQALEAIEGSGCKADLMAAADALRAALAEPQEEPVAWRYWSTKWHCWEYSDARLEFPAVPADTEMEPLYVAALIKENDGE